MQPSIPAAFAQGDYLSILSRAPADAVKRFVDGLIPALGVIEVVRNRTGLVMAPMTEGDQGAAFYLGEVLVAEAYVRVGEAEGYAACLGRDLEQALAIALIDAATVAGMAQEQIVAFIATQATMLEEADQRLRQQVELTRVEMETF